ncbi:MAG: iron uptake porin [Alkalinema sp. RU_4_3]|nr:iron uptake porin [Alkalinema sp. RU_4_3]
MIAAKTWTTTTLALLISSGAPALAQTTDLPDLSPDNTPPTGLEEVNSVDQLTDLSPDHWAYKAVKNLIERYGVLSGYGDKTFKGNRPLSRYEFAASLSALMEQIQTYNKIQQDDLVTLKRLQTAFQESLKEVADRLNKADGKIAQLQRQNFSPTTTLHTQISQAITNGPAARLTAVSRLRLDLNTSFTGVDQLTTQLEWGNNGGDATSRAQDLTGNRLGTNGSIADGGALSTIGVENRLRLRKLYYRFTPVENLNIAVGTALPPSDFIDRNSFANNSGLNFSSSFFANNPLIVQNPVDQRGGAGIALDWRAQANLAVRALYASADPLTKLGGTRNQTSLEAEYNFTPDITARLQYTHANNDGSRINALGLNGEWAITRQLGLFGRLGLGSYRGFNTTINSNSDLNPRSWMLGGTVRNFLITGSTAGAAIGQPFSSKNLGTKTQTNFETYFGFALNDKIHITPALTVIRNPDNQSRRTIWQWTMRILFDF